MRITRLETPNAVEYTVTHGDITLRQVVVGHERYNEAYLSHDDVVEDLSISDERVHPLLIALINYKNYGDEPKHI